MYWVKGSFIFLKLLVLLAPAFCGHVGSHQSSSVQTSTTTTTTVIQSQTVTTYLKTNFRNVKSASDPKSKGVLKEKIQAIFQSTEEDIVMKIIETKEYFQLFVKLFKYKGQQTKEELKNFLQKASAKKGQVRKFALVLKNICKNNSEHKKLRHSTRKYWSWYAVRVFAHIDSKGQGSHMLKARLEKLFPMSAVDSNYLDQVLRNDGYAEFLAKTLQFHGSYQDRDQLYKFMMEQKISNTRKVAHAIKHIAIQQEYGYYVGHRIGKVTSRSDNKQNVYQWITEFKNQRKTLIVHLLQEQQYYSYVKECIGYQEQGQATNNAEALADYWINHYFTQESSIYTSIILRNIFKHTMNRSSVVLKKESSTYINTHYSKIVTTTTTQTTVTQQQQHHHQQQTEQQHHVQQKTQQQHHVQQQTQQQHHVQQQHSQQQTTQTKTVIDQQFFSAIANCKSDSNEREKLFTSVTDFRNKYHQWMVEVLHNSACFEYVKACTGWKEQQHQQNKELELANYWVNNFFTKKERSVYVSIMLRNIYKHMQTQSYQLTMESSAYMKSHYSKFVTVTTTTTTQHHQSTQQQSHQAVATATGSSNGEFLQMWKDVGSNVDSDENGKNLIKDLFSKFQAKKNSLIEILKREEYLNYVCKCLSIKEHMSAEQVYEIWTSNFFHDQYSHFSAIILKNIYLHMTNGKANALKSSNYIRNFQTRETYQQVVSTVTTVTHTTTTSSQHVEHSSVASSG